MKDFMPPQAIKEHYKMLGYVIPESESFLQGVTQQDKCTKKNKGSRCICITYKY